MANYKKKLENVKKECEYCKTLFTPKAWNTRFCQEDHYIQCSRCKNRVKLTNDQIRKLELNKFTPICEECKPLSRSEANKRSAKSRTYKKYSDDIDLREPTFKKYQELIAKDGNYQLVRF